MACLEPVLDAVANYRRIYPDLPGMGRTPAPENLTSADDVLAVLLAFIDGVIGDHPLLARIHDVPEHEAVSRSADIGNAEFRDYFTVQTPRLWIDTRDTSNRPPIWPTSPHSRGSVSDGNSPDRPPKSFRTAARRCL